MQSFQTFYLVVVKLQNQFHEIHHLQAYVHHNAPLLLTNPLNHQKC